VVLIVSYNPYSKWPHVYTNTVDALVKIILTIPLWWLLFRKFQHRSIAFKLLIHFISLPVFCAAWLFLYARLITDLEFVNFDYGTLMWDVYVSTLFYCLQFAIFHGYNFWLHTKRQLIREQELKELAYQSEIKALKAQIEPHFLFNTLNSISASVPPSLEKTRVLIAQLADTFRYALKVSERQFVPLEQELEFIKTWLALERHRFGNRLQVDYVIEPSVLQTPVPPMILQPLVENALNHGISPLVKGGSVSITCQHQDNYIHIIVSDSGIGYAGNLDELFVKGIGLKSTAQRIERLYNETLEVKRNQQGLRFSFRIPIYE
jgi:two-component system LytT family sensor kinase